MAVTYTTKLGLSQAAKGDEVGTWITLWNQDHQRIEARLATTYAGDPNSNVAGSFVGQKCWDTTNDVLYICTTTGDSSTAVWEDYLALVAATIAAKGVRVSSNDTTPGDIEDKISALAGLVLATTDDGSDETRTIGLDSETGIALPPKFQQPFYPHASTYADDIVVNTGIYADDDGTIIHLGTGLTKGIDGAWEAGDGGGLDTGMVANSTTYAVWAIYDPTNDVADVLYSTSFTTPTMPTNYTKKALIGFVVTDGSANMSEWYNIWSAFGTASALLLNLVVKVTSANALSELFIAMGANPATANRITFTTVGGIEADDDVTAFAS